MTKTDDHSAEHLRWLIEGRAQNQRASAHLYRLLEKYVPEITQEPYSSIAKCLVAASFGLWRALFLADDIGEGNLFDDARVFLGKILIDNAIGYPQDRATRKWTFDFYVSAAESALLSHDELSKFLNHMNDAKNLESFMKMSGVELADDLPSQKRRWAACQAAVDEATQYLKGQLARLR